MFMENESEGSDGIFQGCASCRKHCCLLKREKTKMFLYISGREYEKIIELTGDAGSFTILMDGRILIRTKEDGYCPFAGRQGCTLRENRPLPCKFYPYAIMLKNSIYYLIRWTDICECFFDSNDQEEYNGLYRLIYPGLEKRAFNYSPKDEGNFIIVQKVPRMFLDTPFFANVS